MNNPINVETELLTYINESKALKENTEREVALKARNLDVVACFYGFRGAEWPTLEDVAEILEIGTRERVRQIINKAFRSHTKSQSLPTVAKCASILVSQEIWEAEAYLDALTNAGAYVPGKNIKGLLNLMHDLDLAAEYNAFNKEFSEVTRLTLRPETEILLITESYAQTLRKALKLASDRPGRVGIANLKELAVEQGWNEDLYDVIRKAVALSPRAWSWAESKNFWYTFEHRHTTLRTYSEKVFSVINGASYKHLAIVYENALRARTVEVPFPPLYVIEAYLSTSLMFFHDGDFIRFGGKRCELTAIEAAAVAFLKIKKGSVGYIELRDHLSQEGFSEPLINKLVGTSCLIHVDKSLGRTRYSYSLVEQMAPPSSSILINDDYQSYLERLRKLYDDETDGNTESTWRKEQAILQDWLFKGKTVEHCALCGDKFGVNALVTAHKKKRALCTTHERLDPYIVMPVCVFGCDFLYEKGYIYIENGKISLNETLKSSTKEYQYALSLKDRTLSAFWLRGKAEYFPNPLDSAITTG
jgi:hypothetical protein